MDVRWVAYVGSAVIAVGSLVPVSWFRPPTPVAAPPSSPVRDAPQQPLIDIQQHAERLARYRDHAPAPRVADRDPFRFGARRPPGPAQQTQVALETVPSVAPASPRIRLVGMMERAESGGQVRVAVISDERDVYLVKVGDAVGERYRVTSIDDESAVLADRDTSETLRLELQR
ncbi:MAG: hypothetical protein AB7I50_16330 [Vicinamibacterales bacterium]